MTINDLIERMKERPKFTAVDSVERQHEWLNALEQLFTEIESWVAPAIDAGVLKTARTLDLLEEPDLGNYEAPVLHIEDDRTAVRLQPVGARIVGLAGSGGRRLGGLRGRVDIVCGPIKIPLVRKSTGDWVALPLRGEPRELTRETFTEILGEVLLDD